MEKPYFSAQIGERTTLDSWFAYGRPEYSADGEDFTATRRGAGIELAHEIQIGQVGFTGSVGIHGFSEALPSDAPGGARTVSARTLSAAGQMDFYNQSAFTPYLSLGLDANEFDDGLGNTSNDVAPRVGAGVYGTVGGGTFAVNVDSGELYDGVRDVNAGVNWTLNF